MIEDGIPIGAGDFRPPAWLAHPHVQSIFPSLPFRRPGVERRCAALLSASVDEILDCGEGVRLLSHHATHERIGREPAPRLVVLLHGWEGSANSLYVLSLGQYLFDRGFDVVRLNLRDHGDSHHLNPGIFHSCRIAEVVGAVQRLQALYPRQSLHLVGFSLGGNFCLRVAARAEAAGIDIARVVAVCPVLDPEHTMADGVGLPARLCGRGRRALEHRAPDAHHLGCGRPDHSCGRSRAARTAEGPRDHLHAARRALRLLPRRKRRHVDRARGVRDADAVVIGLVPARRRA